MSETKYDFCRIKSGSILRKSDFVAHVKKKFTTVEKLSNKVERLCGLESEVELDHEGMRDLLHDVALNLRVFHLVSFDDEVFLEGLDCINVSRVLLFGQINFAERASSHYLEKLKVFHFHATC